MQTSYYLLRLTLKEQELMSILKDEYRWALKLFSLQDTAEISGRYSELYQKSVECLCLTTVSKNSEQGSTTSHLIC
jgi:hypothetical protein